MKNKPIFIALTLFFIAGTKALSQDAVFTQWEHMPVYSNPALTGNFVGILRLRANHRNQWASLLKDNSYRTSALSAEYKMSGKARKINLGALVIRDKAGSLDFTNTTVILSSSAIQHFR